MNASTFVFMKIEGILSAFQKKYTFIYININIYFCIEKWYR